MPGTEEEKKDTPGATEPEEIITTTKSALDVKYAEIKAMAVLETENKFLREEAKKAALGTRITQKDAEYPYKLGALLNFNTAVKSMKVSPEELIKTKGWADTPSRYYIEEYIQKSAANTTTVAAGGWVVGPEMSELLIEPLAAASALRVAGANVMTLINDKLYTMSSSSVQAYWTAQNTNMTMSNPTGLTSTTEAKPLTALSAVTNKMLYLSSFSFDKFVQQRMVDAIGEAETIAYLRGVKSATTPDGLASLMKPENKVIMTALGPQPWVTSINDLLNLRLLIMQARRGNGMKKPTLFMSERSYTFLLKLVDSLGNRPYAVELATGNLLGIPIVRTALIPDNLGTGTNESEIYLVDINDVYIGQGRSMQFEAFPNGTYYDNAASALVSGISQDITVFRMIMDTCVALSRPESAGMLTKVVWI